MSAAEWGKGKAPDTPTGGEGCPGASVELWRPGERDLAASQPLSLQLGVKTEQLWWVAGPSWLALS